MEHWDVVLGVLLQDTHDKLKVVFGNVDRCQHLVLLFPLFALLPPRSTSTWGTHSVIHFAIPQGALSRGSIPGRATSSFCLRVESRQPLLIPVVHAVSEAAEAARALLDCVAEPNETIWLVVESTGVERCVGRILDQTSSVRRRDVVVESGCRRRRTGFDFRLTSSRRW